jgi:hypothetical protein
VGHWTAPSVRWGQVRPGRVSPSQKPESVGFESWILVAYRTAHRTVRCAPNNDYSLSGVPSAQRLAVRTRSMQLPSLKHAHRALGRCFLLRVGPRCRTYPPHVARSGNKVCRRATIHVKSGDLVTPAREPTLRELIKSGARHPILPLSVTRPPTTTVWGELI